MNENKFPLYYKIAEKMFVKNKTTISMPEETVNY